jgi:hypothetical protein
MNIDEAEDLFLSEDYAKALKIIEPLAKQGDAKAQHLLGTMYREGLGVRKNKAKALSWLRRAGEQNYIRAFLNLYQIYKDGEGTKKDNDEALKWIRKAAEQGDDNAMTEIVDIYRKGQGVKKDDAEALKWLRRSAEQGNVFSIKELGLMYLEGLGVQQDYVEAAKCFNREAERGDDECLKKLLDMYKKGLIRESDDIRMVKLFRKAEEGDSDLQLRFGLRKRTYNDIYEALNNKLGFFVVGGVLTMLLLAWYDWVMFTYLFAKSESEGWLFNCIFYSIIFGFAINMKMSSVMYQLAPTARVSGIPFPVIFYEPESEGSDVWPDFTGGYTSISWLLNLCYYIICSLAIALTLTNWKVEANLLP